MRAGPTRAVSPSRRLTALWLGLVALLALSLPTPAFAPPVGRETRPVEDYGQRARDQLADETRREQEERLRKEAATHWEADKSGPDYSIFAGLKDAEERQALRNRLAADPVARRIGLEQWRFSEPPSLKEIGRVLELAEGPLQGRVELGLFLDPATFGKAARGIREAWGRRPVTTMPHKGFVDETLKGLAGQTWILVGHVEGEAFVMRDPAGREMRLSIPALLTRARDRGVLVVPVGCSTAEAGAPVGFVKPIGTDAVARFLRGLPATDPTIADLLSGLRTIGQTRVNLRDALDQLDVEIADPASGDQISRVKIPYGLSAAGEDGLVSQFAAGVANDAERLRPWWRQAWWRWLGILTGAGLWTGLWWTSWTWRRRLLARPYAPPSRWLIAALYLPTVISVILLIGLAIFLFLLAPWLIFVVLGLSVILNIRDAADERS